MLTLNLYSSKTEPVAIFLNRMVFRHNARSHSVKDIDNVTKESIEGRMIG